VQGVINLGTSENKLVFDVLKAKINEPDMFEEMTDEYTHYFGGISKYLHFIVIAAKLTIAVLLNIE
jgi:hypothetical protein